MKTECGEQTKNSFQWARVHWNAMQPRVRFNTQVLFVLLCIQYKTHARSAAAYWERRNYAMGCKFSLKRIIHNSYDFNSKEEYNSENVFTVFQYADVLNFLYVSSIIWLCCVETF